jgi:hypothetical protein
MIIILVVLLLGTMTFTIWHIHSKKMPLIPRSIVEQALFPVYEPDYLPSGYTIDQRSFVVNDVQVLVFQALDSSGTNIAITEEATPPKFDFAGFYKTNLSDIRNLTGVSNPTVTGTIKTNGRTILSINTGKTWVVMTSKTHFSETELRTIAQKLHVRT